MLSQASSRWGEAGAIVCVALAAASTGCTNGSPDFDIRADVARGNYARAESKLRDALPKAFKGLNQFKLWNGK